MIAKLKELLAKTLQSILWGGLIPDYAHYITIGGLPYTAPSFGIVMYEVGDGASAGFRNLLINGADVGWFQSPTNGGRGTITAIVKKGDIVSGTYGIWGVMRFIPYKWCLVLYHRSKTKIGRL